MKIQISKVVKPALFPNISESKWNKDSERKTHTNTYKKKINKKNQRDNSEEPFRISVIFTVRSLFLSLSLSLYFLVADPKMSGRHEKEKGVNVQVLLRCRY